MQVSLNKTVVIDKCFDLYGRHCDVLLFQLLMHLTYLLLREFISNSSGVQYHIFMKTLRANLPVAGPAALCRVNAMIYAKSQSSSPVILCTLAPF